MSLGKIIFLGLGVFIAFVIINGIINNVNIRDEKAVLNRIQGTWYGKSRNMAEGYLHFKVSFNGYNYKAWTTFSRNEDDAEFSNTPKSEGTFKFSDVRTFTNTNGKYLSIIFNDENGFSVTEQALINSIIYDESSGLYVAQWGPMKRESGHY